MPKSQSPLFSFLFFFSLELLCEAKQATSYKAQITPRNIAGDLQLLSTPESPMRTPSDPIHSSL